MKLQTNQIETIFCLKCQVVEGQLRRLSDLNDKVSGRDKNWHIYGSIFSPHYLKFLIREINFLFLI